MERSRRAAGGRRILLKALALSPLGVLGSPSAVWATDYATALEVFDAVDRLEADVVARLTAIGRAAPVARAFIQSALTDHERHRVGRTHLRTRLHLPAAGEAIRNAADVSLSGLHSPQEALVYAHAEGLNALGDAEAVRVMAGHMVDLSRQLTVIDLWIEAEAQRG